MKTYKGFPHGMPTTEAETINTDFAWLVVSNHCRPPSISHHSAPMRAPFSATDLCCA